MAPLSNFFYLALAIVSLFVMDTSSQATLPPCAGACLDAVASSSGCSPTDPVCVCNSVVIANAVSTCVVNQCSASDAEAAATFFNEFCSGATSPSSASVSGSVEPSTIGSSEAPSSALSAPSSILSAPSNSSTPGSSSPLFTSSFTSSVPENSTQPSSTQGQNTTGPTSSITSRPSTGTTASPASATSSTTSTTPVTNHAERGRAAGSYTSIVFALALALVI